MKMFVWHNGNTSVFGNFYGNSMACVLAETERQAWELLAKEYPTVYVRLQGDSPFANWGPDHPFRPMYDRYIQKPNCPESLNTYYAEIAQFILNGTGETGCQVTAFRPEVVETPKAFVSEASD